MKLDITGALREYRTYEYEFVDIPLPPEPDEYEIRAALDIDSGGRVSAETAPIA